MGIMSGLEMIVKRAIMSIPYFDRKLNYQEVPVLLKRTEADLEYLRTVQGLTRYERSQDFEYVKLRSMYNGDYCPRDQGMHDFFTFDNQVAYMHLRVQIDDILKDETYIYNDN